WMTRLRAAGTACFSSGTWKTNGSGSGGRFTVGASRGASRKRAAATMRQRPFAGSQPDRTSAEVAPFTATLSKPPVTSGGHRVKAVRAVKAVKDHQERRSRWPRPKPPTPDWRPSSPSAGGRTIAQHSFTLAVKLAAEGDDPAMAGHILR